MSASVVRDSGMGQMGNVPIAKIKRHAWSWESGEHTFVLGTVHGTDLCCVMRDAAGSKRVKKIACRNGIRTHESDILGLLGFPPDPVRCVSLPDSTPTDDNHYQRENVVIIAFFGLLTR